MYIFQIFSLPMDEKKNPVYANTSDIANLMNHQVETSLQNLQNPTTATTSATDLHQIETLKAENDRLKGKANSLVKF